MAFVRLYGIVFFNDKQHLYKLIEENIFSNKMFPKVLFDSTLKRRIANGRRKFVFIWFDESIAGLDFLFVLSQKTNFKMHLFFLMISWIIHLQLNWFFHSGACWFRILLAYSYRPSIISTILNFLINSI